MKLLRTPDERFENLPGFPFEPNYLTIKDRQDESDIRIHYVDEGNSDSQPVLMLHGEPSWSFLYRKMVSPFVSAGYRAVVPDLPGFGRSDKPSRREDYTYARHVAWVQDWLRQLDLNNIVLICQDWGGLIGMRLVADEPERFARVVTSNTMMPTGDQHPGDAFLKWQAFSQEVPVFPTSQILSKATVSELSPEVLAAYDAPFPSEWHKAGVRHFPLLIPVTKSDPGAEINRATWDALARFDRPFLTIFGDSDPATRGWEAIFQERVPGAKGQPHQTLERAGHFWQEDCGAEAAEIVVNWIRATG